MDTIKTQRSLGLMSSSSLDGVKAALIATDGVDVFEKGPVMMVPYEDELREQLRRLYGHTPEEDPQGFAAAEQAYTSFHAAVVRDFMENYETEPDVIGFYGHTIARRPAEHYICQLGSGQQLANELHIPVVNRFCGADIAAGGQGAPLAPVYHNTLCSAFPKPLAVLNISGVSSVTWFGANGEMLAFATGPGNAPINDWVFRHGGQHMDYNGKLAVTGNIDSHVLASLMRHKYLSQYPPKSCDRGTFREKMEHLEGLSLADGAATVTAFVAESIVYSLALYLPEMPAQIIVCGGGAKNPTLLRFLRQRLEHAEVKTGEEVGWNAEMIEAQAVAFLAVRRQNLLPASFPATTGVNEPLICGEVWQPAA